VRYYLFIDSVWISSLHVLAIMFSAVFVFSALTLMTMQYEWQLICKNPNTAIASIDDLIGALLVLRVLASSASHGKMGQQLMLLVPVSVIVIFLRSGTSLLRFL